MIRSTSIKSLMINVPPAQEQPAPIIASERGIMSVLVKKEEVSGSSRENRSKNVHERVHSMPRSRPLDCSITAVHALHLQSTSCTVGAEKPRNEGVDNITEEE